MKIVSSLVLGVALLAFSGANASPFSPHPACNDPQFSPLHYSAAQLREIAFSCESPAAVRLFLNRARYVELIDKWGYLASIDGTGESGRQIKALNLYIALIESFSRTLETPEPMWMVQLNQGYQSATQLQENVLRGYTPTHLR